MFVGDDVNICCDCRVEFKTQEDDDEDPASSKDSRELVMAAQTIFQMGGANLLHLQTHTILLHAIYNVRTESWTSVVRLLTNFYLRVPFELGSLCVVRCWRQPICTYCGPVSCAAALGPTCCWSFP